MVVHCGEAKEVLKAVIEGKGLAGQLLVVIVHTNLVDWRRRWLKV